MSNREKSAEAAFVERSATLERNIRVQNRELVEPVGSTPHEQKVEHVQEMLAGARAVSVDLAILLSIGTEEENGLRKLWVGRKLPLSTNGRGEEMIRMACPVATDWVIGRTLESLPTFIGRENGTIMTEIGVEHGREVEINEWLEQEILGVWRPYVKTKGQGGGSPQDMREHIVLTHKEAIKQFRNTQGAHEDRKGGNEWREILQQGAFAPRMYMTRLILDLARKVVKRTRAISADLGVRQTPEMLDYHFRIPFPATEPRIEREGTESESLIAWTHWYGRAAGEAKAERKLEAIKRQHKQDRVRMGLPAEISDRRAPKQFRLQGPCRFEASEHAAWIGEAEELMEKTPTTNRGMGQANRTH